MEHRIIAFSGTHGTGKSTSVLDFAKCLKISNSGSKVGVLMENVEMCPLPINKRTTAESQLWIFTNQIQAEIAATSRYDILVCDRSAVDAIAYSAVAGYQMLTDAMMLVVRQHMSIYRHIYLKSSKTNHFHFDDGFRDSDDQLFRQKVEDALIKLYTELGFDHKNARFEII